MKKTISMFLILALAVAALAGCAAGKPAETTVPATEAPTEAPKPALDGTLEEIIDRIYEQQSVEFMVGTMSIDLTDTSEDGLWMLKNGTGLDSAADITEAVTSEAMIGSIPYSLVLVRAADAANAQSVAEAMKSGIDPRKWICVEADDLKVCGYGDVVMLVMIGSQYAENGLTAQSFVDAFETVCGGSLDFVLE